MGAQLRGPLAGFLALSFAALACSLPGLLLRSAASEAMDSLGQPDDLAGTLEAGAGGALELAGTLEAGTGGALELPGLGEMEIPGGAADLLGGFAVSPAYDIYVGANVSGNCGPLTNSGGFASLTFDSVIRGIRFGPPSDEGLPGPFGGITQGDGLQIPLPGIGLLGEGELGAFSLCPMYEEPDVHPCTVTEGPSPFEPSLSLGPSEMGIPVAPLVGTPAPMGGGEALLLYSIGSTSDLGPIMKWDCEIGIGALGGSLEPVQAAFSTSWDRLLLGEEFSLQATSGDEGETWEWTIRFVPVD